MPTSSFGQYWGDGHAWCWKLTRRKVFASNRPSNASKLHSAGVGGSLVGRDCLGIKVERGPDVRVAQKLLSHFHINAQRPQVHREGVAEGVPAGSLCQTGCLRRRLDELLMYHVREQVLSAVQAGGRREKVAVVSVHRTRTPLQQARGDGCERDGLATCRC